MLRVLLAVPATAAALAAGALPAAAGPSPRRAPARATVTLKDIAFNPAKVTIRRGGTVTFRWADGDSPHNVTPVRARPALPAPGDPQVRLRRRAPDPPGHLPLHLHDPPRHGRPDRRPLTKHPTERMGMSHISLEHIDHTGALREMADGVGAIDGDGTRRALLRKAGMTGAGFVAGGVLFNGLLSPAEAAGITWKRSARPATT